MDADLVAAADGMSDVARPPGACAPTVPLTPPFTLRLGPGVYAVALALLIFLGSDPVYPLLMRGPSEWVDEVPGLEGARRLAWFSMYAVMIGLLVAMRRWIVPALAPQWPVALALAYFLLSALWSSAPGGAVIGIVQYGFTVAFGMVIAVRIGPEGVLKALFLASLVCAAATAVFVALLPAYAFGMHYNTGALRGVYLEKNHLAAFLSYGVCAGVFLAARRPTHAPTLAGLAVILALSILSVSSIALLQTAIAFAMLGYLLALRRSRNRGLLLAALSLATLAALVMTLPAVLAALGEDMTLNGRTELWGRLWTFIERRPVFGYGYRGFWNSSQADGMRAFLGWPAHGAHNVWLQALLFGGAIGLTLWVACYVRVLGRIGAILSRERDFAVLGMAVVGVVNLVWSLFETTQLAHFTQHAIVTGLVFALRTPQFR